jgi:hypothetical protein
MLTSFRTWFEGDRSFFEGAITSSAWTPLSSVPFGHGRFLPGSRSDYWVKRVEGTTILCIAFDDGSDALARRWAECGDLSNSEVLGVCQPHSKIQR